MVVFFAVICAASASNCADSTDSGRPGFGGSGAFSTTGGASNTGGAAATGAGGVGATGGAGGTPTSQQTCAAVAQLNGWENPQCDPNGNGTCNQGRGVRTVDCLICCRGNSGSGGTPGAGGVGGAGGGFGGVGGVAAGGTGAAPAGGAAGLPGAGGTGGGGTCTNVINDGGFELGRNSGAWQEASTNFGSPLCDVTTCGGTGGGSGPFAGTFWGWFGGTTGLEVARLEQSVLIPPGRATLEFMFEIPNCDVPGATADLFIVNVDSFERLRVDKSDPRCGMVGYTKITIDISDVADGGTHAIQLVGITESVSNETNFMVDDVVLLACP